MAKGRLQYFQYNIYHYANALNARTFFITHEIHQFLIFHFDCHEKPNYDFMFVDVINTQALNST